MDLDFGFALAALEFTIYGIRDFNGFIKRRT